VELSSQQNTFAGIRKHMQQVKQVSHQIPAIQGINWWTMAKTRKHCPAGIS